jgi:hypothetical protein
MFLSTPIPVMQGSELVNEELNIAQDDIEIEQNIYLALNPEGEVVLPNANIKPIIEHYVNVNNDHFDDIAIDTQSIDRCIELLAGDQFNLTIADVKLLPPRNDSEELKSYSDRLFSIWEEQQRFTRIAEEEGMFFAAAYDHNILTRFRNSIITNSKFGGDRYAFERNEDKCEQTTLARNLKAAYDVLLNTTAIPAEQKEQLLIKTLEIIAPNTSHRIEVVKLDIDDIQADMYAPESMHNEYSLDAFDDVGSIYDSDSNHNTIILEQPELHQSTCVINVDSPNTPGENESIEVESEPEIIFNKKNNNLLKNFAGKFQVDFTADDFDKYVDAQHGNPHSHAAAVRSLNYQYVNQNYGKNKIIDLYGNARTPHLLRNSFVHVHRELITLKDASRVDLCRSKKLQDTTKLTGTFKYQAFGTFCTHNINNCKCGAGVTMYFLNDVYAPEIYQSLNKFIVNNEFVIVVMQVFPSNMIGGDIVVTHPSGSEVIQGDWYRTVDKIVYSPYTENGDLEQHYIHDDMFNILCTQNTMVYHGVEYQVMNRTNLGSCYSVILQGHSSKKKNTNMIKFNLTKCVHGFKGNSTLSFDDKFKIAVANYETKFLPNNATQLYDHNLYNAKLVGRSKNYYVPELGKQLNEVQHHGHICDYCALPYIHKHVSNAKDEHRMNAAHKQFDYDCPYHHCRNYNHVDCSEVNCPSKNHAEARAVLLSKIKITYALESDKMDELLKDLPDVLRKHTPKKELVTKTIVNKSIGVELNAIQQAIVNEEIVKQPQFNQEEVETTEINDPVEHMRNMIQNGTVIPDNGLVYRYFNKELKRQEFYVHVSTNTYQLPLRFVSAKMTGTIFVVMQGTQTPIDLSWLSSLQDKTSSVASDKICEIVAKQVRRHYPDRILSQPELPIVITELLTRQHTRQNLLATYYKHSLQAQIHDEALANQLMVDRGFLRNVIRHGLFQAIGMSISVNAPRLCYCCCGGLNIVNNPIDVNELDLHTERTGLGLFTNSAYC